MKIPSFVVLIIFYLGFNQNVFSQVINYSGFQLPPKDSAIWFAPGLISKLDRYERVVTFDPNGSELFFSVVEKQWLGQKILSSKFVDGIWQEPEIAEFSKDYNCTEPFISPDGNKLFFISNQPPGGGWDYDIWMTQKTKTGWSSPVRLNDNVNTKTGEWHPAVSATGDLYFATQKEDGFGKADIYFSAFIDNYYTKSQNIGEIINTEYNEWDPYVNPGGDLLIFKSDRPNGFGKMDMYVSHKRNGKWSEPKNLGPKINTELNDDSGDITPDGKYLIFARNQGWDFMDIYWIETEAIKELHPK